MSSKKYCSLDIETTGFDPVKDEILEIGFAFFEISQKGIVISQEYGKVFKPSQPVSETILGLTGITPEELAVAENFAEYRDEIQEQLKEACLVGHNIAFDIKFLQGLGLKLSGQSIDTLDLAQFILPTHHSYNLENLMHYFGVPHPQAHRALADAKAAIQVLENLLMAYLAYPEGLKSEIKKLIAPFNLPWQGLLAAPFKPKLPNSSLKADKPTARIKKTYATLDLKPDTIYNFALGFDFLSAVFDSLKQRPDKTILVLPTLRQVMSAWRQKSLEPAVFSDQLFNQKAFLAFKLKPNLSLDELKFVLKILVWQETNWQTDNISDLNLSFFGGQFRHLITGGPAKEKARVKTIVCDLAAYLQFVAKGWYKNRIAVFVGLAELEKALSGNIGEKISWGYANFLLKSIYNPETRSGNQAMTEQVHDGLLAVDLFFGLVSAMLQTDPPSFLQIKYDEESLPMEKISRINLAAQNFISKLSQLNQTLESREIGLFLGRFQNFFKPASNRIQWLELSKTGCTFYSSPIDIRALAKKIFAHNAQVVFCDCLPRQKVIEFFTRRLGLEGFKPEEVKLEGRTLVRDLFSALTAKRHKLQLQTEAKIFPEQQLLALSGKNYLPAACLLGSASQIKEFYHKNYESLQKEAFVLTQTTASGSKLLRNFAIHPHTLLLATDKFVLKALAGSAVISLPVKTLVLGHLPFDQYTHPYLEAVSKQFENPFEDFSLPKALLNLHQLIKLFHTPKLETVLVSDPKLAKNYGKIFVNYLNETFR